MPQVPLSSEDSFPAPLFSEQSYPDTYPIEKPGLGQGIAKGKQDHLGPQLIWLQAVLSDIGWLQQIQGVGIGVRITLLETCKIHNHGESRLIGLPTPQERH